MSIGKSINKIRTTMGMSQEQFADLFNVSQQSVQKWESGESTPELSKIISISKHFGLSLDAFILDNDNRVVEEMKRTKIFKPEYQKMNDWELYSSNLMIEYTQAMEEGLDVEKYKDLFKAASLLPKDDIKKRIGDILFDIVNDAEQREGYSYVEPSDLKSIQNLRKPYSYAEKSGKSLESRVHGAWVGRVCGCMLGKPIEGIHTDELIPLLKETGNYPMHRYIYRKEITEDMLNRYSYTLGAREYIDEVDGMPPDDDTNYTVLYQEVVENYGKDFTPYDVSEAWINYQSRNAYCTAERVAFINFINGYHPPVSAIYKNPYREWIGAQIRGDYFGYINPGNPQLAAEMAWRDASISHIKNGIYGEMFIAAMLAVAAKTDNLMDIILGGLAEIPYTSRLYEDVMLVVNDFNNGVSQSECFANIHKKYDEHNSHDWCHTNSNAMIVVAALLYGNGDYTKSICMSVETGFDTDCNGATVGSILGMANGIESIPEYWTKPINDTLHTTIYGIGTVKISDRVKLTMEHINGKKDNSNR